MARDRVNIHFLIIKLPFGCKKRSFEIQYLESEISLNNPSLCAVCRESTSVVDGGGRVKSRSLGSTAGPCIFSPLELLREGSRQCITGHTEAGNIIYLFSSSFVYSLH